MTFGSLVACTGSSESTKPTPEPTTTRVESRWTLTSSEDGCRLVPPPLDCPPDMICNPPPVQTVPCPSTRLQKIERTAAAATCTAEHRWVDCSEDWNCGTPPNTEVPCPETFATLEGAVTLEASSVFGCMLTHGGTTQQLLCPDPMVNEIAKGYSIGKLPDGTCEAMYEDWECAPDETCNPPEPFQIVCPPDDAKKAE